jgi:hypothetical protein
MPDAITATVAPPAASAPVRRRVDAAREARDHHQAGLGQLARQRFCQHAAMGAGVAGADDRHGRSREQRGLAEHGEQRRRVGDLGQAHRIVGLDPGDQVRAQGLQRLELGLGLVAPAAPPALAARLAHQARQLLVGPARRAEARQQLVEGAWPDAARAAQLQPVDLLGRGKQASHRRKMTKRRGLST